MVDMTHADILAGLKKDFPYFITSGNKYLDMAQSAFMLGEVYMSQTLYNMAKDLYTHARYSMLEFQEHNVALTNDEQNDYNTFKKRLYMTFTHME